MLKEPAGPRYAHTIDHNIQQNAIQLRRILAT